MAVPYTFGSATAAIPLSQLDNNFATTITLGNTAIQLGNTVTTLNNMTLANVTISSVSTAITAAQGGTGLTAVGSSGNVLTSNGTTWLSQAPTAATGNVTIGNTTIALGGTATSVGNLTLTNATISSVSTPITPAQGGTGLATLTANNVLIGNGTSNVAFVAPGTNGNVLTSNGTAWVSSTPSAFAYPAAGIANSTGSAWGTSYSTTGSGTVVALATSPTFTTPVLGTPTSGNLSNCTADGTNSVGFLNIPINSQSAAYTLVLADAGKAIFHPSTDANARTFTIPANSSVAYPIGTAISFINMTSQVVSIAITTDTMYLSSAGTTGTRSLAQYGTATAVKMTSTTWIISGSGLT
jgi:hypothetical protein